MDELAQASTTAFYTLDPFHGVRAEQVVRAIEQAMEGDFEPWSEWVHECRLSLMRAELDWGIHMGHQGKEKPGPLQAFNVSLPIWFDGLNKNALMHSLRRLWLAKIRIICEI